MSHDEYLLALDELETRYKNLKTELHSLTILLKTAELNLNKLKLQEEHFKEALEFSRKRAKVVELKVYINTKQSLDECRKQAYNLRQEIDSNVKKQKEANKMIEKIGEKIKSFREKEKDYGKLIRYDFRGNKRVTT